MFGESTDSERNQQDVFKKHLGMFAFPKGAHLIERTRPLGEWVRQRTQLRTWPYARSLHQSPSTRTRIESHGGMSVEGINFGSQDYLGLSSHPAIYEAALRALGEYGPHSAASPMLQGNTGLSRALEREIAELVNLDHVLLFPTGWAAGFGAIVGLVRPNDHIVIDQLAHACLMQGARAATQNHYFFRHNSIHDVKRKLHKIRSKDSQNAILVVSEGLFSMDSDSPHISSLQEVCHEHGAVLLLDVAHDLGATGASGAGQMEVQKVLGRVDLVMGSFSKTFSSNGGFLATHDLSVKQFISIYGGSHIVPVTVGDETLAKWVSRSLEEKGLIANLVEFPAVSRGTARFRFQVMATHTPKHIESGVEIFLSALDEARARMGDTLMAGA